ncbi:acetylornithine deacetylase [Legionella oakridgensis]|uniref:Acetylornithine deacetylase ArgE n=2 Tax=Legionella oakridgensis TaxID=29423 RepID=W0BEM0_9GAMM|nr:acetylornithine deacetylase [Legionella oakridgensis]AHE67151.1 acetylornithine deacetylase ArgE [Legionella oakridgensis ATCC 33761 = DSM 21215]ETO93122.1 acetylornithine deacetylase (ArgE) [Legionella oakridgensis RV-2-2007]KTD38042.1 acetylornithine deacetylase [Legionella oakridgensis]STY20236.1 Acetylornithine deacetylase [Legionella longbeachae]
MDAQQWLASLISFDTTSRNTNIPLIEVIEAWCKRHHLASQIILGRHEKKANLFATIPAKNGEVEGGIILSGHTDVVPVDGQLWDSDPFVATEHHGKIYGRGTADMKGFIAVVLALLPEFKTLKLKKPIHVAFTCDEEIGCLGVPYLLDYLQRAGIHPEACIVGEPSGMRPIVGYKGRQVYHCQIRGLAAHSSLTTRGCNAIEYACRLICYIKQIADYLKKEGPFDNDFDVEFTTMTTNIISGGEASNIIPGNCEFIFEIRYIPNSSLENIRSQIENYINHTLLPEMQSVYSEAAIYLDLTSDAPGFTALEDEPITSLVRTITGEKERFKVSYSTEAGLFQRAHIPTLICGPGHIEQAHRPNEYISIDQLKICESVLRNVIHFFCLN